MFVYLREYLWPVKLCKHDLHAYAIECTDVEKVMLLKEKKIDFISSGHKEYVQISFMCGLGGRNYSSDLNR